VAIVTVVVPCSEFSLVIVVVYTRVALHSTDVGCEFSAPRAKRAAICGLATGLKSAISVSLCDLLSLSPGNPATDMIGVNPEGVGIVDVEAAVVVVVVVVSVVVEVVVPE